MLPILYKKGLFIRQDTGERFVFQFNPETIDDSRAVNYVETNPIQSEQPLFEHMNAGPRTVSFTILLNGLEDEFGYVTSNPLKKPSFIDRLKGRAIEGAVGVGAKLLPFAEGIATGISILNQTLGAKFRLPPPAESVPTRNLLADKDFLEELRHGTGDAPPPEIEFIWEGYNRSSWILWDLKFKETMWDKNTFPIMMTVDITLKETFRSTNRKKESLAVFLVNKKRSSTSR